MNAYEAMIAILDSNETIEELKKRNESNTPDFLYCKITELLTGYRELLVAEMRRTILEVFNEN